MIYILILSLINKVKYKIKMKINEGYYNIVDKQIVRVNQKIVTGLC